MVGAAILPGWYCMEMAREVIAHDIAHKGRAGGATRRFLSGLALTGNGGPARMGP